MEITKEKLALATSMANHKQLLVMYEAIKAERDALKEQNAELAAQVSRMSTFIKLSAAKWENCHEVYPTFWNLLRVANETPKQHLAEIRAEAVLEFASFIYRQFENGEYHRLARHKFQQLNSRAQGQTTSIHNDVEYCGILGNAEFYAAKVQQGGE